MVCLIPKDLIFWLLTHLYEFHKWSLRPVIPINSSVVSFLIENIYFNRPILKNQQLSMLNFLISRKTIIEYHRPFIRSDRRVRIKTLRSPWRTHQMLDVVRRRFTMVRSASRPRNDDKRHCSCFHDSTSERRGGSRNCRVSTGLCDKYDRRVSVVHEAVHRGWEHGNFCRENNVLFGALARSPFGCS